LPIKIAEAGDKDTVQAKGVLSDQTCGATALSKSKVLAR